MMDKLYHFYSSKSKWLPTTKIKARSNLLSGKSSINRDTLTHNTDIFAFELGAMVYFPSTYQG